MAKAQAYYIEFIIALFVFIAALGFFVNNIINSTDNSGFSVLAQEARISSDCLISEGIPGGWNQTNVQRIGLTDGFSRLNETKLLQFKNMGYIGIKNNLNIRSEYYFYLEDKNGTRILIDGDQGIGLEPTDAKRVVKNLRLVIYNSEIVRMVFLIWQKI